MSASFWLANLVAWWLQASLVLAVGLLLSYVLPLPPAPRLRYLQGLLAAVVALPLLQVPGAPLRFAVEVEAGGGWLADLAAGPARGAGIGLSVSGWLLALLALGTAARLGWLFLGWLVLASRVRGAQPAVASPVLEEMRRRMGTEARFLVSPQAPGPVTFGWRRPVVLLPAGFSELPLEAQRAIACHELLHVARRDWPAMLVEESLRAALWFHPGVWLLLARLDLAREQVVDAEVVRLTGQRRAYLAALWSIATHPAAATGLPFLKRSHLRSRVAQLAKEVPMRRSRLLLRLVASSAALAAAAWLGIWSIPMSGVAYAADGAKKQGEVMRVSGDVQPPRRLSGDNPVYPKLPRDEKIEGKAILDCVIDTRGKITSIAVAQSAGHADLDQAARDAVATWTFAPATLGGKPVSVYYTITLNFQLDSEKNPKKVG